MTFHRRSRQGWALLVGCAIVVPFLLGQGCPGLGGGSVVTPTVTVYSPSMDQTIAAGQLVTVVYDAYVPLGGTVSVSAFYDRDGVEGSGDEVTFWSNLASGLNKFVQLDTSNLGPGDLYVGITASNSSGSATDYAPAKLTISGAPTLIFTSPASNVSVGAGVIVPVDFFAGVGVNEFTYRIFYDTDKVFDGDEVTITTGSNTTTPNVSAGFETSSLSPGTYYVGARVTTATGSVVTGYAGGAVQIVTGSFVQVLSPTIGLVAAPGTKINVTIVANDPTSASSTVRIFYDLDRTYGNGNETTISVIPVSGTGTIWDTTAVPAGAYYIGAALLTGFNPPPLSYSAGAVQIAGSGSGQNGGGGGGGTFAVTSPLVPTELLEGNVFRINWRAGSQPGEATITIFREPDRNLDGVPDGAATRVTIGDPGIDASRQFIDFDTQGSVGTFFIGGTLTPVEGPPVTAYAPATLTIRPLIFWVGNLDSRFNEAGEQLPQTSKFQGAVFRGHNLRDNLGSAMTGLPDYDGDGRPEILLAAQFGKPFIQAQSGRGAGEAYLIYGLGRRFAGTFEVNATGLTNLPGLILAGIMPNPYSGSDIVVAPTSPARNLAHAGASIPYTVDGQVAPAYASEGLQSITLVPDQDGDEKPEIAFGFPWVNSYSLQFQLTINSVGGQGRLENNGHFLRGGVVVLSSTSPELIDRNQRSRGGQRAIYLQEVGQMFGTGPAAMAIDPRPPALAAREDRCDPQGTNDTVLFPNEGFWQDTTAISPPRLADPQFPVGGDIFPSNSQEWYNLIALTQVDPPVTAEEVPSWGGRIVPSGADHCTESIWPPAGFAQLLGTGFYTSGINCADRTMKVRQPPYGARILGQTTTQLDLGTTANRFGQSIAAAGEFLLVGAPLRSPGPADVNLLTQVRREAGMVYMLRMTNFWNSHESDQTMPAPHNFIINDGGYTTCDSSPPCNPNNNIDCKGALSHIATPFKIVGAAPGDQVGQVTGLRDINRDGLEDFAVGGPRTNGGRGAVYIIYSRQPTISGDYLLERLQLDPANPDRLNGMMIIGETGEELGTAIAGGGNDNDDYNADGFADVVIGSPLATSPAGFRSGQVFILFGGRNLLSPAGGSAVAPLVASGDGMLLTGANAGDSTGMTVANAGDVNGDGFADLLIAAPDASPRFDSNGDGNPDAIGIDYNGDGVADDLDANGTPDDMTGAGLVYVVFGGRHLTGVISLSQIGTPGLPGFVIVGRKGGDRLGGGYTQNGLLARGVISAGDVDTDQRDDLLISSILADPDSKTDAGEVYLVYGLRP